MSTHRFAIVGLPVSDTNPLPADSYHSDDEWLAILAESNRIATIGTKPSMIEAQLFDMHVHRIQATNPQAVADWRAAWARDWQGALRDIRQTAPWVRS